MSEVFVEEVEAENEIGEMGSEEESEDFETLKEHATERFHLRYPFDQDVQRKLRKLDCSQFENLRELISIPKNGETCVHNYPWSEEDPIENEWIYSKSTKIAYTNFVTPVERQDHQNSEMKVSP